MNKTTRLRLCSCLAGATILTSAATVKADKNADLLIKQGAACEAKLQSVKALGSYLAAEKLEPQNADLLVRIARQYRHLMADAPTREEKMRMGTLALNYGERAAALAPKDSDAQLSTAISYGKMLPLLGSREQIEVSRLIKQGADKALALEPHNDLAWHILGRWYSGLADISSVKRALASLVYDELPQATNADAAKCFEKAIEINPKRVIHCIELGCTYAEMGKTEEAKDLINKGLSMPSTEKDDAAAKVKGRQELAKLR